MSNAWGSSWGESWGSSWGTADVSAPAAPAPAPSRKGSPGAGSGWNGPRVAHPTWWEELVERTPVQYRHVVRSHFDAPATECRVSRRDGRLAASAFEHATGHRQSCRHGHAATSTFWHAGGHHKTNQLSHLVESRVEDTLALNVRQSLRECRRVRRPLTAAQIRQRAALLGEGMPLGSTGIGPGTLV